MSTPTVTIDKISISIGEKKIELTLLEIQELKRVLAAWEMPQDTTPSKDLADHGEVAQVVTRAVSFLPVGFSILDVEAKLGDWGHNYARSSIRGALGRLKSQGKIRIHLEGAGRRPTSYSPVITL